jgi:MFS transporter, AAHS family, 4-hydroxybenzoate transporter
MSPAVTAMSNAASEEIDAGRIIDEMPWSAAHTRIVALCGAVGFLDGMDSQTIGIVARPMAADLAIPIAGFGPVFSAMTFGAALGAIALGSLADRFGRKRMMVATTVIFALFTFLTAQASSLTTLIWCRFAVGLGLGGAVPCFISLGSEYVPLRWRQLTTSALWIGFPLGGILGAFAVRYLLEIHTWRSVFYFGGLVPLLLAVVLLLFVPESLQFLIAQGIPGSRIIRILRSLQPALSITEDARFRYQSKIKGTSGMAALFGGGRWRVTALLWVGFAFLFGTLSMLNLWSPTLLGQRGMSVADTATAIALWNVGGVIGTTLSGPLVKLWGHVVLPVFLILGAISAALLGHASGFALPALLLLFACLFLGASAGAAISLAGSLYESSARATGIGWAMGIGRLGQAAGPLAVGGLVALQWPLAIIFLAIAVAPVVAAVAMAGSLRGRAS